jgi:hypothetical protein
MSWPGRSGPNESWRQPPPNPGAEFDNQRHEDVRPVTVRPYKQDGGGGGLLLCFPLLRRFNLPVRFPSRDIRCCSVWPRTCVQPQLRLITMDKPRWAHPLQRATHSTSPGRTPGNEQLCSRRKLKLAASAQVPARRSGRQRGVQPEIRVGTDTADDTGKEPAAGKFSLPFVGETLFSRCFLCCAEIRDARSLLWYA